MDIIANKKEKIVFLRMFSSMFQCTEPKPFPQNRVMINIDLVE
jgi:hypothetical protein